MKIMTILGTRPEIIRLSVIIKKLDEVCKHVTVWTGQNYDDRLSEIFFEEFGLRSFNHFFSLGSLGFAHNVGMMIRDIGDVIDKEKPDKVLILGDTNSSLAGAIVAERMGVPVYHMEAGNRCYDMKVPEEKNRIMIDAISSFNLPYVENSRKNLLQSGFPKNRIFKCGNPISEVMSKYWTKTLAHGTDHILVTAHRAENVDDNQRLFNIISALNEIASYGREIIFSVHPRTKERLEVTKPFIHENVKICKPFNFTEFLKLERESSCIITDSGTVQEEAAILQKPCVIIRDSTERPETLENGSHIVSGLDKSRIVECFNIVSKQDKEHSIPDGYNCSNVSDKVINYLLGNQL